MNELHSISQKDDDNPKQTANLNTAQKSSEDKPARWYSCSFGPIIATEEEYKELFKKEKQNTYTEAELFIEHFNNFNSSKCYY